MKKTYLLERIRHLEVELAERTLQAARDQLASEQRVTDLENDFWKLKREVEKIDERTCPIQSMFVPQPSVTPYPILSDRLPSVCGVEKFPPGTVIGQAGLQAQQYSSRDFNVAIARGLEGIATPNVGS